MTSLEKVWYKVTKKSKVHCSRGQFQNTQVSVSMIQPAVYAQCTFFRCARSCATWMCAATT